MGKKNAMKGKTEGKVVEKTEGKAEAKTADQSITELVFILDRSGSMSGLESDTIGGFNGVLAKQKEAEGTAYVSTILFDHEEKVLHDRVDIAKVEPITEKDYQPRGSTALLDALGNAIRHTIKVQGYLPEGYKADKVIFTVITDGYENASCKFSLEKVRKMVEEQTEKGWEFVYLGANLDAVGEAGQLGIASDRAVTYLADSAGSAVAYDAIADFTVETRRSKTRIGSGWKKKVEADTKARS